MAKSVPITPQIQSLIAKNNGGESIEYGKITVYEAIVASDRPIKKPGSIFNGGIISADTLKQMANYVNGGGFIPLQTLHPNGDELPIGRFFYAETLASILADGSTDLRALFYLTNDQTDLITRLDTGVIDEVSVTVKTQQMLCSKCGWDFLGSDATFFNLYDQTCENDHVIGTDGTYLKLNGLDRWTETSLVSKGASSNAKILGRTKQRLGQEQYERLAASGISPEAMMLIATTKEPRSPKTMDKELIEELANLKAGQKIHEHTVTLKDAEITALKASVESLTTENKTLKEGAELKAAQTSLAESQAKVVELTASAKTAETEIAELKAKLTTAETQVEVLKAGAGSGGRSQAPHAGTGATGVTGTSAPSAFKSAPRR